MRTRTATLAVLLVAAAPALAQKDPVTIDAQTIEGVSDLEVTARGAAEIRRGDTSIYGEVLRYNRELGRVEGEGGVRFQQGVDRFFGPRVLYNTFDDTGVFEQPQYLLERHRTARGGAERLEFLGRDRYRLTNASFTTCRPGQEDWYLRAETIDLDYEKDEGKATSPRLRFFDSTILASPWATFPLSDRRRSGLLAPYYAQTSTRGAEFGLPYYWNMAPERDVTLTPLYMGKRGAQLKTLGRYMGAEHVGEVRVDYLPDDREANRSRDAETWQHLQTFGPGIKFRADYNRVSDDAYLVDLSSQVRQITQRNLPQDFSLSYNGLMGPAPYFAEARVQRFQTLQDPLAPVDTPYRRVPQLKFNAGYYGAGGFLDSTLHTEAVRFSHPSKVEASRALAMPTFAGAFVAPGWFVTPKVGVRGVGYAFDGNPAGAKDETSVSIPWMSFDTGLIMERESIWYGKNFTQTLEPRLFYVYIPYRGQNHIPVFDTDLADFNYPQLFTENRFVGGDRFGDANQLTLALTSRFLHTDGQESFRMTLGQRYYFANERVGLPDPLNPATTTMLRTTDESPALASVGGRVYGHLSFDATIEYVLRESRTERYNVSLRHSPQAGKVLNAAYRFNREQLRQIDVSGQWPVTPGWFAVGRYNYSLLDNRLLEGLGGIEYQAGCWAFRTVVQRVRAATQLSTTGLYFQLEFNGAGAIGTDEAVSLLKRNVPGYSVTNPSDPTLAPPSARPRAPFEQVY
jgi:LPS-assembly protein